MMAAFHLHAESDTNSCNCGRSVGGNLRITVQRPLTPQLERLPSGWNLMSMELTPFEPQALDIFSIVTDEQVMLDHENRRRSCVQEKIDLTLNSRLARVTFPLSNGPSGVCVCL